MNHHLQNFTFLLATTLSSSAASISIPNSLNLDQDYPFGAATASGESSVEVDLSDLSGLTPNQPIQVTFELEEIVHSFSLFVCDDQPVNINSSFEITMAFGGYEASIVLDVAAFEMAVPGLGSEDCLSIMENGFPDSGPVLGGFATLFESPPVSVDVPWGTDLTQLMISLSDQSYFSTGNGLYSRSLTGGIEGTISTVSVPEPSGVVLLITGLIPCLRRRRSRFSSPKSEGRQEI